MTLTQQPIGHRFIFLDTVDSTNNYAATQLKLGEIGHGTVIMAENQTNGRGQRGNSWQSSAFDNLIFSLVIEPQNKPANWTNYYSWIAALSLIKLLKSKNISAQIKWPNDIIINNKKVAGILIENSISGVLLKSVIVGIGINLNQREFEYINASSLHNETKEFYNPKEIGFELTTFVKNEFERLEKGENKEILADFIENLWRKDEIHQFEVEGNRVNGIIQTISEDGQIIIEINGERRTFAMKEISFIY